MKSCCVPFCESVKGRNQNLGFFEFPAKLETRVAWLKAISKEVNTPGSVWQPTGYTVVCEKHFNDTDISKSTKRKRLLPGVVPSIFPGDPCYNVLKSSPKRKPPTRRSPVDYPLPLRDLRRLRKNSHSQKRCLFQNAHSKMAEECSKKSGVTEIKVEASEPISEMNEISKTDTQTCEDALPKDDDELMNVKLELYEAFTDISNLRKENEALTEKLSTTEATQNDLQKAVSEKETELVTTNLKLQQAYKEVNVLRTEKEQLLEKLTAENIVQGILQHPRKLRFYTGLNSMKDFNYILSLISVESCFKNVSLETQLLIVLMKLKLNLYMTDLGYRFRIPGYTVGKICDFIIPFLEAKIYALVKCPINAALKKNIPVSFKNTVYENLYQRLVKYSKSKTKQPEDDDDDTDFEKLDEECI